mmetsp:Transcript_60809/g.147027  ORF Transcript_60809/g.147027 Transcript_60809/m.147027 type:complete len:196 (+) Transcript_60809:112-699(+)
MAFARSAIHPPRMRLGCGVLAASANCSVLTPGRVIPSWSSTEQRPVGCPRRGAPPGLGRRATQRRRALRARRQAQPGGRQPGNRGFVLEGTDGKGGLYTDFEAVVTEARCGSCPGVGVRPVTCAKLAWSRTVRRHYAFRLDDLRFLMDFMSGCKGLMSEMEYIEAFLDQFEEEGEVVQWLSKLPLLQHAARAAAG